MNAELLQQCYPHASKIAVHTFAPLITAFLDKYHIDTPLRLAHFLAQVGHESGELRYTEEIASGDSYEGRTDLGNTKKGDGRKYKGRGLIQLTGRINYTKVDAALGAQGLILTSPEQVATVPYFAAEVAGWFWDTKKLFELADKDALTLITKRVNGGVNGIENRRIMLKHIKKLLLAPDVKLKPKELQQALNAAGARPRLIPDGIVGTQTKLALEEFQRHRGLNDELSTTHHLRMYL